MSTNMKYEAAKALGTVLAAAAPTLNVQVLQNERDQPATYPALAILPRKFRKYICQDQERWVDPASLAQGRVVERGHLRGKFELRVYTTYPVEREQFEQDIADAFEADEAHPGAIILTLPAAVVGSLTTTYTPPIAVRMGDSDWTEEMVFSQKRFAFLEVDVSVPVLARQDAPTITQLYLDFLQDVDAPLQAPPVEEFLIPVDANEV